jgi:WD40 repeat protein
VKVWDAGTGEELHGLTDFPLEVSSPASHPAKPHLLAVVSGNFFHPSSPAKVQVWDLRTGKAVRDLEGHTGRPTWVGFSPDGQQIYTAGVERTVRTWDARTGRQLQRLEQPHLTKPRPQDRRSGCEACKQRQKVVGW